MADPVDIKLQIAFGLSGIISIIIAIANLHPKNSLGAEWFRSIRACVRGTGRRTHRHDDIISNEDMWQEDEESSVAMLKISSVNIAILSSRLSLKDFPVQQIRSTPGLSGQAVHAPATTASH
jgi:hypothetical protein